MCDIVLQVRHIRLLHKIVTVKPHFLFLTHEDSRAAYWLASKLGLSALTYKHSYAWYLDFTLKVRV